MVLHLLTSERVLATKTSLPSVIMYGDGSCGAADNIHCATLLPKCVQVVVYKPVCAATPVDSTT